jgi:hypothetical protein
VRQFLVSDDLPDLVSKHVQRMQEDESVAARRNSIAKLEARVRSLEAEIAYATQTETAAEGARRVALAAQSVRLCQQLDAVSADLEALRGEEARLQDAASRQLITVNADTLVRMLDEGTFERQRAVIEQVVAEIRYHHAERTIELVLRLSDSGHEFRPTEHP